MKMGRKEAMREVSRWVLLLLEEGMVGCLVLDWFVLLMGLGVALEDGWLVGFGGRVDLRAFGMFCLVG
jgi:hypothetical protein